MKKIWDITRIKDRESSRMELTDLIRFKGSWYCGFHEGVTHHNHPTGRGRIIRSLDGEAWESVALFEWRGGDVREPKLSITPEGWLMANTSIYFVSREPRNETGPGDSFTPTEESLGGPQRGRHRALENLFGGDRRAGHGQPSPARRHPKRRPLPASAGVVRHRAATISPDNGPGMLTMPS